MHRVWCMGVQSWPHTGLARHEESVQLWAQWIAVVLTEAAVSQPTVQQKCEKCAITSTTASMLFTEPVVSKQLTGMSGGRRPPMAEDGLKPSTTNGATDFRVPSATANWLRTTYQIDNAAGT